MMPHRPSTTSHGVPDAAAAVELLAASSAALVWVDADGALRWANDAAAALFDASQVGQPLAALLGLGAEDSVHLNAALAGEDPVEVERRDARGAAGWLQLEARPLADGSRIVALTPIDALKAATAQAQTRAELLDLAREMGRLGVWERDLRTGIGHWDAQVYRMRGLEPGAARLPSIAEGMRYVLASDRPAFEQAVRDSLAQAGTYAHSYRVRAPGAEIRYLHSQWIIKNGSDGRPKRVIGLVMDDTQASKLARSHDETLSQLALAVDLAGIAIWRHDLASDRIFYNDQAFRVIDMDPRPEGLTIAEVRAQIHPDDLPQVLASAKVALETGQPTDMEARYRRGDGSWRTVMTRRVLQRDVEGQPTAFIGVALDVTDRVDASRRAIELGRQFELATHAAGIGYWSLDAGAERPRWSARLRSIHGLPPEATVPTFKEWVDSFVHVDERADVLRRFVDWLKSGRSNFETDQRIVRSDGEVRYLITHSRVEGRAQQAVLFGLVIDVTERRRVEMALREASERAALAARGAGLGTWEFDLRDGSAYWDAQMWRLRGLEPQAHAPSVDERMAMVYAEDRSLVEQHLEVSIADDVPSNYEFRVVLPDGRTRWLASRSMPVRDEQGRAVRRIGVNWDVTDSRTSEAVRQEREIALRESQAKSKFLARMSHELRTPLNGVLGFAQLLLAEDKGSDAASASRRRRVEQIHSAGQHLLSLINDVLDLSSLEGGELRIVLQPVPLAPLVAATIPLLEPLLRERRIELVSGMLDVVPLADATRLRQVLLNLLSNAVKYNHPGGRVTLESVQHDSGVIVRVSDTGRGMNDEQLRHLFEPFNRLGIEGEGIEGTGIGLAIVKALVERMGGSVHVDSTPGVGSLFELRLLDAALRPVPEPAAAPPNRPIPLAEPQRPPRGTLLYVEDNPINALIISELIARRPDLKLHIAPDGASGVQMAHQLLPDLVLLDMQLPDFDGHEVLRRLRADAATAKIPVIALSANAMPEDIDRALRAGMADYWTKPLDFAAFMASIEALFGPAEAPLRSER